MENYNAIKASFHFQLQIVKLVLPFTLITHLITTTTTDMVDGQSEFQLFRDFGAFSSISVLYRLLRSG